MWTKIVVLSLSCSFFTIAILKRYFGGKYCNCKLNFNNKVIIVTGATSGIGKETATILASKGAQVVLACRYLDKGQEVVRDIKLKTGNTSIRCEKLDLSSLQSVIDFVNRFRHQGSKLHGLVNNAGLFHVPFQLTEDGFDLTLQTNYLGPFLLTYLLLDILKESAPARIVNIGSESHRYPSSLNVNSLTKHFTEPGSFDKFEYYGTTKLCIMLFTTKLDKLLKGSGVTANSVNPGNVRTKIFRHFPAIRDIPLLSFSHFLLWMQFKTPYQGAQSSIHVLADPALAYVSGKYFSDCAEKEVSNLAKSTVLEDELWSSTLTWLEPYVKNANIQRRVVL